ncbi:partial 2-hydroxy-3-oxopropionate reductase, partial [Anaerolineae bacterium]
MNTHVGFIGLGRMGQPMCRHILQAGFALTVFDLQAEAMHAVVALGARAASSGREVARASDVV